MDKEAGIAGSWNCACAESSANADRGRLVLFKSEDVSREVMIYLDVLRLQVAGQGPNVVEFMGCRSKGIRSSCI